MRPSSMAIPHRPTNLGLDLTPPRKPHTSLETKTDYGKYRYDYILFAFRVENCTNEFFSNYHNICIVHKTPAFVSLLVLLFCFMFQMIRLIGLNAFAYTDLANRLFISVVNRIKIYFTHSKSLTH